LKKPKIVFWKDIDPRLSQNKEERKQRKRMRKPNSNCLVQTPAEYIEEQWQFLPGTVRLFRADGTPADPGSTIGPLTKEAA
jgi:hypothetical protein